MIDKDKAVGELSKILFNISYPNMPNGQGWEQVEYHYKNIACGLIAKGYSRHNPGGLVELDKKSVYEECAAQLDPDWVGSLMLDKTIDIIIAKFGRAKQEVPSAEELYITLCLECGNKERGDLLNSEEKELELRRYAKALREMLIN